MLTLGLSLLAATSTAAEPRLSAAFAVMPVLLDYELPGHPNTLGRGHVGAIAEGRLIWGPHPQVDLELGVIGRLPFALDLEDEPTALPILAIVARPAPGLSLRFGSLDPRHGYHPALLDEPRFAYGRNVEEAYNRFIPAEAARELGTALFPPAEHGAQLVAEAELVRAELFLDWQLLETEAHREKFHFGVLGEVRTRWLELGLQFRLTHYGGQLFTKGDPLRNAQLDPVRQPETAAIVARLLPLRIDWLRVVVPLALIGGHLRQDRADPERWHWGFEAGLDTILFDALTIGYRAWLPRDGEAGFLAEDSEPVYNQGTAHRLHLALSQRFGDLTIDGALDLVVPEAASDKVQYLTVTRVRYAFDVAILGR